MASIEGRTVCDPNCHANPKCGITATITDGRITAVRAADYPVTGYEKRICMHGLSRLEYQYHPDRLRTPLKRVGPRGAGLWEEIGWEEATDLFVAKQKAVIDKYGSKAVSFSSYSGAMGLINRFSTYRYAALTGGVIYRSSGVDYGLPKGLEYLLGVPAASYFITAGHDFNDTINSDVTFLWGGNPAVTRSVDHVPLKKARRNGTRLICIDPIKCETASLSDEWYSIRPGTDGALALAMGHELISHGWIDEDFLLEHTNMPFLLAPGDARLLRESDVVRNGRDDPLMWCAASGTARVVTEATDPVLRGSGELSGVLNESFVVRTVFDAYADLVSTCPVEVAASITDVPAETIRHLAKIYGTSNTVAIRLGFGLDRWYYSDVTARAIGTLVALRGMIGVPGGGISILAGHRYANVDLKKFIYPDGHQPYPMTMMEIDSGVIEGKPFPIKMDCISHGNPFNQGKPNRQKLITDYVNNLEFITVIDHFMTDTAQYADLVLPACTIFERKDVVADELIQLQQRLVEPEGDAKTDFEIFSMIAAKMGLGKYFNQPVEHYIEEVLSGGTYSGGPVKLERLLKDKVIYPHDNQEPHVGLASRRFRTKSGRIEIFCEQLNSYGVALPVYNEPIEASPNNPDFKKYPFILLTSHSRYRIHSTFANLDAPKRFEPEPTVRIHPDDAQTLDLSNDDLALVSNDRGYVKIKCRLDEKIRPGCVLIGQGRWTKDFIEGDPYSLTHDLWSETSENFAVFDVLVNVEAVPAG